MSELIGPLRNFIHGEARSHGLHGYEDGPRTTDYREGAIALDADVGGWHWRRPQPLAAQSTGVLSDGVVLVQPAK